MIFETVTCCHTYQTLGQTCTWVENPEAPPQTPGESPPPSSSWSAESDITQIL